MKKLLYSLVASCLLLPIASPAKAESGLISTQIIAQHWGDMNGLGFECLYYEYQYTWAEDSTGQIYQTTYWLNTNICDLTSNLEDITPTDFGL